MTQIQKLNDSAAMRWGALFIVAFTMMAAYYVNDVMAPLKTMLAAQLNWTSDEYGTFTGAYSFLNVFFLMLLWGGLILDKIGVRLTGIAATLLMVAGTAAEWYALNVLGGTTVQVLGMKQDVFLASAGYAVFGVGAEVAGITVTKIIARWFAGKEMALAMGVQVALARIGSQAAYAVALPLAKNTGLTTPLLIGLIVLVGGFVSFLAFTLLDKKLDAQIKADTTVADDEKFSFADVLNVVKNPGFWLIALLCVLFYSCVFPFQKYATELMTSKYGVSENLAGTFVGLPALGALILTPVFGGMIDKRGRSASIMVLGAAMLIAVHATYAIPTLHASGLAIALMIVLGIAFSLVPSAMWPAVAKIFPAKQLGTAYALIFLIQNVGLWGVPTLIGYVLESYCKTATGYDYTLPMIIFTSLATLALVVALLLKAADKKFGYNLELPNIKH
ncbi:MAG: MFS transporter [Bacteroidales bacterium]|nr:MFS transporter [Bacteroidales bacterium]